MRFLRPTLHGIIDYIVVAFLLLAPSIIDLTPFVSGLTYVIAGVHLLLTVLTNFPMGIVKLIPLRVHGYVELVVSFVLMSAPWTLGFAEFAADRIFYLCFGAAVLATWAVTRYAE